MVKFVEKGKASQPQPKVIEASLQFFDDGSVWLKADGYFVAGLQSDGKLTLAGSIGKDSGLQLDEHGRVVVEKR